MADVVIAKGVVANAKGVVRFAKTDVRIAKAVARMQIGVVGNAKGIFRSTIAIVAIANNDVSVAKALVWNEIGNVRLAKADVRFAKANGGWIIVFLADTKAVVAVAKADVGNTKGEDTVAKGVGMLSIERSGERHSDGLALQV